ncbi:hypothetical protein [Branchiibius cervicis]|uniref:Uncharacterized protein n=1 Tax=Branchiibius cervicis TaxID=908252 RepID=A0ABW2ASA2_9MICO
MNRSPWNLSQRPPVDGGWTRIEPWWPGLYAVIALTGHAFVSAPSSWSDDALTALGVDGFGERTTRACWSLWRARTGGSTYWTRS